MEHCEIDKLFEHDGSSERISLSVEIGWAGSEIWENVSMPLMGIHVRYIFVLINVKNNPAYGWNDKFDIFVWSDNIFGNPCLALSIRSVHFWFFCTPIVFWFPSRKERFHFTFRRCGTRMTGIKKVVSGLIPLIAFSSFAIVGVTPNAGSQQHQSYDACGARSNGQIRIIRLQ